MLATTTSGIQLEEHLYLKDSKRIYLGTGTDLQIWHDGSNSYIADNGTGDLYLSAADNFYVRKAGTSEVMFKGTADGAAELYFNDSKKLFMYNIFYMISFLLIIKIFIFSFNIF